MLLGRVINPQYPEKLVLPAAARSVQICQVRTPQQVVYVRGHHPLRLPAKPVQQLLFAVPRVGRVHRQFVRIPQPRKRPVGMCIRIVGRGRLLLQHLQQGAPYLRLAGQAGNLVAQPAAVTVGDAAAPKPLQPTKSQQRPQPVSLLLQGIHKPLLRYPQR